MRLCGMKSEKVYIEYLVLKVQAGEKLPAEGQVGDELFAMLQAKVKAFVLKILCDRSGVDDCIQTTLLQVFNKLGQLKNPKAFHTWLYRVAYSCCMDYCRKNNTEVDNAPEVAAATSDVDQQLDVKTAIAQLPETLQVIIFLFYYEGFTVVQMADILKQPAGTIKYQLFEARQALKKQLVTTNEHINNPTN